MEIDHVVASGVVVGRTTTHSWPTPLVRGDASNHASWRKNVVNSYNWSLAISSEWNSQDLFVDLVFVF